MLKYLDVLPKGFLDVDHTAIKGILDGPSLIHLKGDRPEALFISTLLHGNEPAGLAAIQRLLEDYAPWGSGPGLPRDIYLFVGNVDAAEANVRRLPGQPDFNRVWPGTSASATPEKAMLEALTQRMKQAPLIASIDIHNNSGINPHYGCINRMERGHMSLAARFSRHVVYFRVPKGVQSLAFSDFVPSVTMECGQAGDWAGVRKAAKVIRSALECEGLELLDSGLKAMRVHETRVRVEVRPGVSFGFRSLDGEVELHIRHELGDMNFVHLSAGTLFATYKDTTQMPPLIGIGPDGEDCTEDAFLINDGEIRLKQDFVLSMFTIERHAVEMDCLCYLMTDKANPFAGDLI